MTFKTDLWKKKLDPAFDKIIKYYLQFIEYAGLPANTGWLSVEDKPLKLWEEKGMQGWIKPYEKDMTNEKNTVIKWKLQEGITEKERIKARRDFEKGLLEEIKILPKDSQEYYKETFAPFYSENIGDDYFKDKPLERLRDLYTDLITDQFLLSMHVTMIEMENESKNSTNEALEKKYIRNPIIFNIVLAIYNSIALLVFEKSLMDLIKDARTKNDKESFFNLLQIDRTVVECEWAQKMIRKAQLTGDEPFFKRMAKSIATPPLQNDKEFTTARIVILLFWHLGLRKLDYPEMIELIEACGIQLQESPEAFERFVRRLIRVGNLKKEIITFPKDNQATS